MRSRTGQWLFIGYLLAAALGLAALAALSMELRRYERRDRQWRAEAAREELVRLALGRLETRALDFMAVAAPDAVAEPPSELLSQQTLNFLSNAHPEVQLQRQQYLDAVDYQSRAGAAVANRARNAVPDAPTPPVLDEHFAAWTAGIADLLPDARLRRISPGEDVPPGRRLAAAPVALDPGPLPPPPDEGWSPLSTTLAAAWGGFLVGMAALAALLRGVYALAARRGAFVAAVTHELRTPLTTFRLYTDLLADDMVPEDKRPDYLATLHHEAGRLERLVDQVLAFARLERRRPAPTPWLDLRDLTARVVPRLEARANIAGFDFVYDETTPAAQVRADADGVERVLENLVENATKYGRSEARAVVAFSVAVERGGRRVALRVRDYGPGVPPKERRRIFAPFVKAKRNAAGTLPGVGLGLALARAWARGMGARMDVAPPGDGGPGAVFTLRLRAREMR